LRSAAMGLVNVLVSLLLLALSSAYYPHSPLISIALLVAAVDQLIDAYQSITGKNPYPRWLFGLDLALDIYQILIGVALVLMGLSYIPWLESPVYPVLFVLAGALIAGTSVSEIVVMDPRLFGLVKSHEAGTKRRRILR